MKREIKFEVLIFANDGAFESSFNEWLAGDGWKHNYYKPLAINGVFSHEELGDGFLGKIIRRRFTSLQDSKDVDIYEGDVMQRDTYWGGEKIGKKLVTVAFKKGQFILIWHKDKVETYLGNLLKGFFIIGNIYQNPELLKP